MPSTFTANLNLEKPATGEQNLIWGNTINSDMDLIDAAVFARATTTALATTNAAVAAETARATAAEATKQAALGFTPYNATNPAGYQTAAQVSGTLGNVVRNAFGGNAVYFGYINGALAAQVDNTYAGLVPSALWPGNFVQSGGNPSFNNLGLTGSLVASGYVIANGSYASSLSGWQLNSGGTGGASGSFNLGVVANNNAMLAFQYVAASDGRLKSDRTAITDAEGERFVRECPPYRYIKGGSAECGFIAQDLVAADFGETVSAWADETVPDEAFGYSGPQGEHLIMADKTPVAYLAAALRSALARIDVLETHLASQRPDNGLASRMYPSAMKREPRAD